MICGIPFPVMIEVENICYVCLEKKPIYKKARAVVRFDETALKLIHNFKYYDRIDYAVLMANLMSKYYADEIMSADLITAVPMHNKRIRKRKYNQSLLLAKKIAKVFKKPLMVDLLLKVKDTPSQSGLNKEERVKNIKSSIAFNPKYRLRNQRIIVVDDVITTGSTMNECAKVLARNGNNQTIGLAFARTYG